MPNHSVLLSLEALLIMPKIEKDLQNRSEG